MNPASTLPSVHFQTVPFRLLPLTPIHIGSGEEILPFEYDLRPVGDPPNRAVFFVRDMPRVWASLTAEQREHLYRLMDRAELPAIRAWLRDNVPFKEYSKFQVKASLGTFDEFRNSIDDPNRLGQVDLMTRCGSTGRILIPGSSLKGALRTPLIAAWANCSPRQAEILEAARSGAGPRFESRVMGNVRPEGGVDLLRDPFRQWHVEDLFLGANSTSVRRVVVVRAANSQGRQQEKIRIWREVTDSLATDGLGPDFRGFAGTMRLYPQLAARAREGGESILPRAITVREIVQRANEFFGAALEWELAAFPAANNARRMLLDRRKALEESRTQCLVRVGRHSHFECVTVGEPFANPPRRGHGKTRTWVNGEIPLGWALLDFGS